MSLHDKSKEELLKNRSLALREQEELIGQAMVCMKNLFIDFISHSLPPIAYRRSYP